MDPSGVRLKAGVSRTSATFILLKVKLPDKIDPYFIKELDFLSFYLDKLKHNHKTMYVTAVYGTKILQ